MNILNMPMEMERKFLITYSEFYNIKNNKYCRFIKNEYINQKYLSMYNSDLRYNSCTEEWYLFLDNNSPIIFKQERGTNILNTLLKNYNNKNILECYENCSQQFSARIRKIDDLIIFTFKIKYNDNIDYEFNQVLNYKFINKIDTFFKNENSQIHKFRTTIDIKGLIIEIDEFIGVDLRYLDNDLVLDNTEPLLMLEIEFHSSYYYDSFKCSYLGINGIEVTNNKNFKNKYISSIKENNNV